MSAPNSVPYSSSNRLGLSFTVSVPVESPQPVIELAPASEDEGIEDAYAPTHPHGRFNIWARYYILTYKYHLEKQDVVKWFTELAASRKMKDIIVRCSHESGSKKIAYLHTHVFVDFGRQFKSENARVFDHVFPLAGGLCVSDQPHPNIGGISKRQHLMRIYRYMCKEDHSNDDMASWATKDHLVEDYWEHDDVLGALRMATRPSDIPGILAAYALRPRRDPVEDVPFEFLWQQELFDLCTGPGSKRTIHWVFDHEGGMGKSDFTKLAWQKLGKKCTFFTQFGGGRDAATVMANALESGNTGEVIIVDLPRAAADKSIYEPIEMFKNGLLNAIKYTGKHYCFDNKVIVVLANFLPKFYGEVTPTRWRIWNREMYNEYFSLKWDQYLEDYLARIRPPWEFASSYDHLLAEDNLLETIKEAVEQLTADQLIELSNSLNCQLALNRHLSGVN